MTGGDPAKDFNKQAMKRHAQDVSIWLHNAAARGHPLCSSDTRSIR
jgi:hypothetical protein